MSDERILYALVTAEGKIVGRAYRRLRDAERAFRGSWVQRSGGRIAPFGPLGEL